MHCTVEKIPMSRRGVSLLAVLFVLAFAFILVWGSRSNEPLKADMETQYNTWGHTTCLDPPGAGMRDCNTWTIN